MSEINMENFMNRIQDLEQRIAALPQGNLVYKQIKGKKQPYLQWKENGKTVSRYIKIAEREQILAQMEEKKLLQKELADLNRSITGIAEQSEIYRTEPTKQRQNHQFRTHVLQGDALMRMTDSVQNYKKRDCYALLRQYIYGDYPGRVCLLYGLRRTGKTTLLFQMLRAFSPEEFARAVYIKARTTDTMANINQDLQYLSDQGYQYIFIDEVTLMEDFIDSAALFSDIYAMMGIKIVLSGTDSLGFWFTMGQELYDRAFAIHTTYIPFREYARVLDINSIDEYIRYGGTLRMGESDFGDDDLLQPDASFRDEESTRRYIDSAICKNIQHSLACCRDGQYLRHLRELYEAGELTGAINRLIESMNHQFLLSILTKKFKSHDLGSAAELLRKQPDPQKRTDILDHIDREIITKKLMDMLEIRNQEDQRIGVRRIHLEEIKEYLKALDLVTDCPSRTIMAEDESSEYVLFTQPGMRYSQAQALVYILLNDSEFELRRERERNLVRERIFEDVLGRMMEDIILLETSRALKKKKQVFKLIFSRSEFDMVIYDPVSDSCELYEIKHSTKVDPRQYRVLANETICTQTEQIYGRIAKKCVIYRGESRVLDNGIRYENAEEYLVKLGK